MSQDYKTHSVAQLNGATVVSEPSASERNNDTRTPALLARTQSTKNWADWCLRVISCVTLLTSGCGVGNNAPPSLNAGTVGFLVEEVRKTLNDSIDSARSAGDYLSARTLSQVQLALQAWRAANEDLLNEAVSKVDQQRIRWIGDLQRELKTFQAGNENVAEDMRRLSEAFLQSVENLPLQPGRIYITRHSPTTVPISVEEPTFTLMCT